MTGSYDDDDSADDERVCSEIPVLCYYETQCFQNLES